MLLVFIIGMLLYSNYCMLCTVLSVIEVVYWPCYVVQDKFPRNGITKYKVKVKNR